jgi:hypothetical protein
LVPEKMTVGILRDSWGKELVEVGKLVDNLAALVVVTKGRRSQYYHLERGWD